MNARAITPAQRAQVARAVEHARAELEHAEQKARAERRGRLLERRQQEVDLARRLLEHIAPESPINRGDHALGVARMILNRRPVDLRTNVPSSLQTNPPEHARNGLSTGLRPSRRRARLEP